MQGIAKTLEAELIRRNKISKALTGRIVPKETRNKISMSQVGQKQSKEEKEKRSYSLKKFARTEIGMFSYKERGNKLKDLYASEKGLQIKLQIVSKLKGRKSPTLGMIMSKESNEKRSISMKKRISEGFIPSPNGKISKPTRLLTVKGGLILFRSLLESRYSQKLDSNCNVVSFTYEDIRIPYYIEDKLLNTIPDFTVTYSNGDIFLDEVKPLWTIEKYPKNKLRIKAMNSFAKDNSMIFRIWDGNSYYRYDNNLEKEIKINE